MATEVGSAFLSIIPKCDGAKAQLQGALNDPMGSVGDMLGSKLGGSAASALSKIAIPAAVIGIGAAVGKELYDVGASFDAMYDSISAGTGATGDALAGLEESARNVYANVPASLEDVGDALAELNTRTGATGETLETLTSQFLNLEKLGYSADIDAATGMMNAWGVATDDMSTKMDELFVVSQSTGVSIDSISSAMSTNAASMQELGFSFEQTAAMAGQFDKAGLDASGMMSKMSKACISLAQDGEQPAEAYQRMVSEMQSFVDAGDKASAMNLATDLFGTKGAAQFIQALETGAMDIDAMTAAMAGADGAIEENAKSTRSAAESFQLLQQNAMLCLEPLGSAVFGAVSDVLAAAVPVVQEVAVKFNELFQAAQENETVQEIVSSIGDACSSAFSLAVNAIDLLVTAWGTIQPAVQPVIDLLTGAFLGALDAFKAGLANAGAAIDFFKGLFKGEISFPHIKLPHFNIDGGELPWGIGGAGRPPTVSVDWYAQGGIMDGATPFRLSVGGEAGKEAIMPLEGSYMQPFAQATAQYMGMDELISEVRALRKQLDSVGMYVDGKKMVGALISEIDSQSSKRDARRGRWVAV